MGSPSRRSYIRAVSCLGISLFAGCIGDNVGYGGEWRDVHRIQLLAERSRWVGVSPDPIVDANNPSLRLIYGRSYELEWENGDDRTHGLEIRNHEDDVVERSEDSDEYGQSRTISFEAVPGVTYYTCPHFEATMTGSFEIFSD